ncbi:MAG: hypothetical protein HOQ07_00440 [Sinomonas sp.]|nr:hypothetical protein [Sinomonas sp.]
MTSRRERRLAQAASGDESLTAKLTPAQARAEAEAKAAAEADLGSGESTDTGRIRSRRALDAPVDAVRPERTSQARARDREAHRVLRELAEKEKAAGAGLPSRRALRQQSPEPGPEAPAETRPAPTGPPAPENGPDALGDIPAGALPVIPRVVPPPARPPGRPGEAPPSSGQGTGPRRPPRQAPVRQAPDGSAVLGPETGSFSMLSHEQIAAARELLRTQGKNQAPAPPGQGSRTDAVDPETLKQQVAQAERAAVLSRRAETRQRLEEASRRDSGTGGKAGPAPTAANNLAMVTPLEYEKVPGLPVPVMKRPSTTHVPVVTDRTPAQSASRNAAREAAPVSAASAHGLEPLGVQTSRTERERIVMLSIGAFGIVALIVAVLIVLFGR